MKTSTRSKPSPPSTPYRTGVGIESSECMALLLRGRYYSHTSGSGDLDPALFTFADDHHLGAGRERRVGLGGEIDDASLDRQADLTVLAGLDRDRDARGLAAQVGRRHLGVDALLGGTHRGDHRDAGEP